MDLLKRLAVVVAIALGLVLVIWLATRAVGPQDLRGKAAPDFTLYDLRDKEVAISAFRGHPVLLDFWETWCGPCIGQLEALDELGQEHPELRILAINTDGSRGFAQRLAPERKYPHLKVLYCGPGRGLLQKIKDTYTVSNVPRTFILDRQGIVRADLEGAHTKDMIVSRLEDLGLLPLAAG